jgi:large subunit ribosomal protein L15
MPLQRRLPKRGFTNIFKVKYQVVNLDDLARFESGTKINRGVLIEAGLVKKASEPVKVLGRGELKVALEIEVDHISRTAAKAILDAGGSVSLLSGKSVPVSDEEERQ